MSRFPTKLFHSSSSLRRCVIKTFTSDFKFWFYSSASLCGVGQGLYETIVIVFSDPKIIFLSRRTCDIFQEILFSVKRLIPVLRKINQSVIIQDNGSLVSKRV